jgi:hypothetical protein
MSGYLQRLTRSVIQPKEAVHPMLGSVFAPANSERPGGAGEMKHSAGWPETQAPPVKEKQETQEVRTEHLPPPVQTEISTPLVVATEVEAKPTSSERASFQPLIMPAANQDSTVEGKRETDAWADSRPDAYRPKPIFTPLVMLPSRRQPHPEIAEPCTHAAAPCRATERLPLRVEHSQDDVQIHIGRIEVTAVQQAPARMPSKTPRKAQNLDEYLKHRDRRV